MILHAKDILTSLRDENELSHLIDLDIHRFFENPTVDDRHAHSCRECTAI
jgi:hypothetical protein